MPGTFEPMHSEESNVQTLSERIIARIQRKPNASVAARNRSVFLSLREEIQQAYTEGWSLLAIWQVLHDEQRVTFTYQAFRRYARQLIVSHPPSVQAPSRKAGTFKFDPTSPKDRLR
jgi:hypothetical protein